MTLYFRQGESIVGEKLFYCFGSVPEAASHKQGRYVGTLQRRGWVGVVVPLRRAFVTTPNEPDEIHCEAATFSCTKRPRFPGKQEPCGAHRCWTGYLKGDAEATVKIPFPAHM